LTKTRLELAKNAKSLTSELRGYTYEYKQISFVNGVIQYLAKPKLCIHPSRNREINNLPGSAARERDAQ
jgi:hypothetical protein